MNSLLSVVTNALIHAVIFTASMAGAKVMHDNLGLDLVVCLFAASLASYMGVMAVVEALFPEDDQLPPPSSNGGAA